MKKKILSLSFLLYALTMVPNTGYCAQKPEDIDPCGLVTVEKMRSAFPQLQRAEKKQVGPTIVCNYLDKFDIPALIVSVNQAGEHARDTFALLDSGYVIQEIADLGDNAAIAIQQANPTFGLQEGVAALQINKGDLALNLSFTRLTIQPEGPEIESVKSLATEMLSSL
ncbi:hypothetical protein [Desulfopila aestuarii]|uniref:Uncharacterized protein n=1 Tax=Desulfopila aestuarii DSM 18488 TaxID=1121416 RepID=A0A1M7YGQ8_9BACT|nr:hypothetical protein [Desulfopila aestuarii]SHO51822.1 hypothetical protein SAMN02745220_04236 [Desulfopila aestuarii DSM 18488]